MEFWRRQSGKYCVMMRQGADTIITHQEIEDCLRLDEKQVVRRMSYKRTVMVSSTVKRLTNRPLSAETVVAQSVLGVKPEVRSVKISLGITPKKNQDRRKWKIQLPPKKTNFNSGQGSGSAGMRW